VHLIATVRPRQPDSSDHIAAGLQQIEVDADTYDDAKQQILNQMADEWIVTAYRVDRPGPTA
jgi:hypothetical protein